MVDFELEGIVRELERHHELFRCLWDVGMPCPSHSIDTAAVAFSSSGAPLRFLINPDFWQHLPPYDRAFILAHEMLHIALGHGLRTVGMKNREASNVAADLVVNHLLIAQFGFSRALLTDWKALCWVETVFPDRLLTPTNLPLETYYLLCRDRRFDFLRLADSHDSWPQPGHLPPCMRAQRDVDAALGDLPEAVRADLVERLQPEMSACAGHTALGHWSPVRDVKAPPVAWLDLLRRELTCNADVDKPSWCRLNRRMIFSGALQLPAADPSGASEAKATVSVFVDASGSVWQWRHHLMALARSLPGDRFVVDAYSFDTLVYPLSRLDRTCGGGGTDFACIERQLIKGRYPRHVVVITDGEAPPIKARHPERWLWLVADTNPGAAPMGPPARTMTLPPLPSCP